MKEKAKKGFELFEESLREGVRYAQGKKAKVKVETLRVRLTGEDIKAARQVLNKNVRKGAWPILFQDPLWTIEFEK